MPAMHRAQFFPVDIAEMPASTRTSFTRVDHDHPDPSDPPAVPPVPSLYLTDSRFDGERRIFYDYTRDGGRPVTADGDVPPGEYRMRQETVPQNHVPGDAETEEGVPVHGGEERNWDYHSPVDSPQPGGQVAAETASAHAQAQAGENSSQASPRTSAASEVPSQVSLTFLLVNGKRRVMNFDSYTSVGRVKELVWNTWPNGKCYVFRLSFDTFFLHVSRFYSMDGSMKHVLCRCGVFSCAIYTDARFPGYTTRCICDKRLGQCPLLGYTSVMFRMDFNPRSCVS